LTCLNVVHLCVNYRGSSSCTPVSYQDFHEKTEQELIQMIRSEINFLKLQFGN
jgi:hypothetical protein